MAEQKKAAMKVSPFLASLCLLSCLISCGDRQGPDENTMYLKAFSDVYGVVRWFYPGDEAQDVDWNALALEGVRKVDSVNSKEEFQSVMTELFCPIASGVVFSSDPVYDDSRIIPEDTAGLKEIAWQHYGVDLGKWSNSYVSKRTYRNQDSQGLNRLVFEVTLSAADYIGDDLTLSVDIENMKPSSLKVYAKVSLDVNDADTYINFCEFVPDYLVGEDYQQSVSIGREDSNKLIRIGVFTEGTGEFFLNSCTLSDGSKCIDVLGLSHSLNQTIYDYYDQSRRIRTKEILFDDHSHVGDVQSLEIIDGLFAHIPLALYGNEEHTFPLASQPSSYDLSDTSEQDMMLADLIATWNVIKYFHPYISDEVEDWDGCLVRAFEEVGECSRYSLDPLRRMMANVNDAHFVANSPKEVKDYGFLPVRVRNADGKICVIRSIDEAIRPGDEIMLVDGRKAIDLYEECEQLVSGSPQYKRYVAEQIWLRQYVPEQTLVLMRDGEEIAVSARKVERSEFVERLLPDENLNNSRWINKDTLYLNTALSDLQEIKELLSMRNESQTILIDIRNGSRFLLMNILPYIADKTDLLPFRAGISRIPKVFIPQTPVIKDTLENIDVPVLKYDNVFITGPMNYSHDEEVVDYALYCGVATTTGEPTAGCNGRINRIPLPSGGAVYFTGTKVFSSLGPRGYYYGKGISVGRGR